MGSQGSGSYTPVLLLLPALQHPALSPQHMDARGNPERLLVGKEDWGGGRRPGLWPQVASKSLKGGNGCTCDSKPGEQGAEGGRVCA